MSTVFTQEDFRVEDGKLRLAQRGPAAVLIMSRGVPAHLELLKVLKSVKLNHLETGYLDITQGKNREVINMSRETGTPIAALPSLLYFYDGKLKSKCKKDNISKSTLEVYFQEKMQESATQNASSERKNMTGGDTVSRFSMAQQNNSANGKKVDPKALGSLIGINVAWRSENN